MKDKLNIIDNWSKGLTLSKQEVAFLKAGNDDAPTCGELTQNTKEQQTRPTKVCPCHDITTG